MARYQIAVIGDKDSVLGFKALGLATFPVDSVDQARTTLRWAARTYLVAALSALASLVYYLGFRRSE